MNNRIDLIRRWQRNLRSKADEYEHKTKSKISRPSLDDIANEMEAFLAGLVEEEDLLHEKAVLRVKKDLEKSGAIVALLCKECGFKKLFKGRLCEDCWYEKELRRLNYKFNKKGI